MKRGPKPSDYRLSTPRPRTNGAPYKRLGDWKLWRYGERLGVARYDRGTKLFSIAIGDGKGEQVVFKSATITELKRQIQKYFPRLKPLRFIPTDPD